MKKVISIILVLAIVLTSLFAYQNTYRLSSDEVQDFLLLRKVTSSMTPDPTYPISASQLASLVKSIDTSKLSGAYLSLYNSLLDELESPEVYFENDGVFGLDGDLSVLAAQAIKTSDPDGSPVLPYKDRLPLVSLKAEAFIGDNVAAFMDADVRTSKDKLESGELYLNTLKNITSFSYTLPSHTYVSVGNDNFNFVVGKDRLGSGNGFTGNLEFGENVLFEDFAKLSYMNDFISYDFVIDSFNEQDNSVINLEGFKKNIYVHRLSYSFKDLFNVTIYEGMLAYTTKVLPDIQMLNPLMIFHQVGSYYNATSNNYVGVEALVNLKHNYQLDAQVFIDQICLPSEDAKDSGETAIAALLNISKTTEFRNGILNWYIEGVYGNPYVYLKNTHTYGARFIEDTFKYHHDPLVGQKFNPFTTDLVINNSTSYNNSDAYDLQYLGYKYGGDLFSVAFGADYKEENLKLTLDVQYLAKGNYGIRTNESRIALGRGDTDDNDETYLSGLEGYTPVTGNIIQTSLTACLGADFTVKKGIDINAKLAVSSYRYFAHDVTKDILFDPKFAIGVSIRPIEFFNIEKTSL